MNQPPMRRCPRCGTEANTDQRFCPNCGASIDRDAINPTVASEYGRLAQQPGQSMTPPPPPDVDEYATFRQQSNNTPPGATPYHSQTTEGSFVPPYSDPMARQMTPQSNYVAPVFTGATPGNTKKILGGIGCGAGLLIVLALAICGALGYGAYFLTGKVTTSPTNTANSTYKNGNTTSTSSTTSNSDTTTPAPTTGAKTIPLNLAVKYATIMYTIVDIKQGSSFEGDSSTAPMIRVDLKETNPTSHNVIVGYSDIVRLILPDQSAVVPNDYKQLSPPANGASQDNWLDFPVPATTAIDKLSLRFGTPQEAQMDVPLTPGANLAKFQDVTVKPNTNTTYAGLKWTLTSATFGWSAASKQAETGKRYVTINVSIDNPTVDSKNGYWGDYLRLKAGNLTSSPETDSTVPLSFAAYSTGATGSASFLVPQDSTSFTMILLADKFETGAPQASIDFHIP